MSWPVVWSQSGGPLATYEGEAQEFAVHYALTTVRRLMFLTYLCAYGEATQIHLNGLYGGANCANEKILRAMERVGLIRGTRVLSSTRLYGGKGSVTWVNPYRAEAAGRRWLHGYGLAARRVLIPDDCEAPLRADVPECPLAALGAHARTEFLRPAGMALASRLGRYGAYTRWQLGRATEMSIGNINAYLQWWRRSGFLERIPYAQVGLPDRIAYRLTEAGHLALRRHVDALRRMGMASGEGRAESGDLRAEVWDGGRAPFAGDMWGDGF